MLRPTAKVHRHSTFPSDATAPIITPATAKPVVQKAAQHSDCSPCAYADFATAPRSDQAVTNTGLQRIPPKQPKERAKGPSNPHNPHLRDHHTASSAITAETTPKRKSKSYGKSNGIQMCGLDGSSRDSPLGKQEQGIHLAAGMS